MQTRGAAKAVRADAKAARTARAATLLFGNNDLAQSVVAFCPTTWGLRRLSLVSRAFKGLVRARVRRSLYMCNKSGVWRICLATGRVEKLAEFPYRNRGGDKTDLWGHGATTVDGAVVVAGSASGGREAWRFDPLDCAWRQLPSMQGGRSEFGIASVRGRVFVLGGKKSEGSGYAMEYLDARRGAASWRTIGPQGGYVDNWCMHGLVASGDHVYAVGGSKHGGVRFLEDSDAVHRMDATAGSWGLVAPMSRARRKMAVCGGRGDEFYALGGMYSYEVPYGSDDDSEDEPPTKNQFLKTVERYSASEKRWTTLHPMRAEGKFVGAAFADGRLWAVHYVPQDAVVFLDQYDPAADAWNQKHSISCTGYWVAYATISAFA